MFYETHLQFVQIEPTILFLFFDQEYLQMAQNCYLQDNCLYVYPKRFSHPNMCNKNFSQYFIKHTYNLFK